MSVKMESERRGIVRELPGEVVEERNELERPYVVRRCLYRGLIRAVGLING